MYRPIRKFFGTKESGTEKHEIKCFANTNDEVYISISVDGFQELFACIDVSTAIKLSKTIRTEINLIKGI